MQKDLSELFPDWSDELKATLLHNNSLCIALFSADKSLIFANPAMTSLFKEEESWKNILNPGFESLAASTGIGTLVYSGFLTIGSLSTVNASIQAEVYKKNGELLIVGGVDASQLVGQNQILHSLNRDISNLQRQLLKEKQTLVNTLNNLNEANTELRDLNTTKEKLFSIIAHDLRNPFVVLLGFSEMLMNNAPQLPPEKIQQYANNIFKASENTYNLVMNLLEWSRLQKGLINPVPGRVKPDQVIKEVVLSCENLYSAKQINLVTSVDYDDYVLVDQEMLKVVLRNLLTNAIKYTRNQGNIKISVQKKDDDLLFVVSDSGVGIGPHLLDTVFRLTNTPSKAGTSGEKGTGLGLILCKEFAEKLNGKIWVESELNKGSDFKFTIPLDPYNL